MRGARLRPRLVAVWLLLAGLVAVVVVIEYTDAVGRGSAAVTARDSRLLVPAPVDQLGALEIADAGTLHRFERDAASGWFYHGAHTRTEGAHSHPADPAAAQRIEKVLAAFCRTRIERQLARGTGQDAYGVTTPRILILVYRSSESQPFVQYAVGDVAPDTVSRYVEIVGGLGVVTIPTYQIDNLLTLIPDAGRPASR